jgi:hypothetical protein
MLPTLNGFTLLPFPANWSSPPAWQRAWENEVAAAVTGDESRQALRVNPRNQLSFLLTPWTTWELAMLDDLVNQAKKSGTACAPFHGRSSVLQDDCSANEAVLQDNVWGFAAGDYVFFCNLQAYPVALLWDCIQITAVDGATLSLASNVSQTYLAQSLVWPVLYGEFTCKDMSIPGAQRGSVQATIRELSSPASAATVYGPGEGPAVSGIGIMQIGSTFKPE